MLVDELRNLLRTMPDWRASRCPGADGDMMVDTADPNIRRVPTLSMWCTRAAKYRADMNRARIYRLTPVDPIALSPPGAQ